MWAAENTSYAGSTASFIIIAVTARIEYSAPTKKMLRFSLATEIQESDKKTSGETSVSFFPLQN